MKKIFSIFISTVLTVSAFAQTRNVLVGTNDVIVSPSNFWNANASNARIGLGLGSAATNPSSAFQPASTALSNLATSGVLGLTNGGTGATNASGARSSLGATTVGGNLFTLSNPSAVTFIRINADNTVSSLNASDFRNAIGVSGGGGGGSVTSVGLTAPNIFTITGSPITNSGTLGLTLVSQSSRNFFAAPSGGGLPIFRPIEVADIPNLSISNVTGLQSILDGKLSTTGTAASATNVTGIVSLQNGGTGATNAITARTALGASGVGSSLFTLPNPSAERFIRINADNTASALSASDFRTAISLGTAATSAATAFQPASSVLTNLSSGNAGSLTNLQATNLVGLIPLSNVPTVTLTNISGTLAITSGGTGATNAATARTNLELGWSALTNTDATNFRNAIGIGITNTLSISNILADRLTIRGDNAEGAFFKASGLTGSGDWKAELVIGSTNTILTIKTNTIEVPSLLGGSLVVSAGSAGNLIRNQSLNTGFGTTNFLGNIGANVVNWPAAEARTNLGLPWSGLTNTNAVTFQAALFGSNTNPVLVNTNGEVVSPTNFWQAAPITTTFIESQPNTNFTTNITPARFLHIHSLATNIVNVTNTIVFPTNTLTFEGDVAIVVHKGPTNSMTRVQRAGSTNNLITLTRFDEAVQFVYYNDVWQFDHNVAFVEPIYFSGTNAVANAAASRTNLSLGATWLTNTNVTNFRSAIGLGATNDVTFRDVSVIANDIKLSTIVEDEGVSVFIKRGTNEDLFLLNLGFTNNTIEAFVPIGFNNNITNAAITRTNLGLGGTNSVTFSALTLSSDLTLGGGDNIVLSTTNGTKIGTATNQLLGFYNQTPIAQPSTTGVTTNGFTQGSGNNIHPNSTFTGGIGTNAYTISDIVAHLKSLGLLAP
jgi:hypothetical protein